MSRDPRFHVVDEPTLSDSAFAGAPPLLSVQDLSKSFTARKTIMARARTTADREVLAVDSVSFDLARGQTLGIVGESGSGKTTLVRLLVGLVSADSGTVIFDGEDVTNIRGERLRALRRRMQLIYQDPYASLHPALSVGSAITEPAVVAGLCDKKNAPELAHRLLEQVGLRPAIASRRPHGLSGGQRQRVAIARALAAHPEVLIADEAVSALDVSVQAQILALFKDLKNELGLTMIFVAHQLATVAQICDRILIMYRGRVVEEGPTADVFGNPAHPYTAALLASHPRLDRRREPGRRVNRIREPAAALRSGCNYRDLCPIAGDVCEHVIPRRVYVGVEHSSWCHKADEVSADLENRRSP